MIFMIKAVIFDLWSTLAYNDTEKNIIKQIFDGIGIDGYKKENQRIMEESFMKKRYNSPEDAMQEFCNAFGKGNKCVLDLTGIWNNIKVKLFDDALPTLKELKGDYRVGLITNTQSFALDFFYETGFFDIFDYACLSFDVGLLKPDPEIFRLTLDKLGVEPEEAMIVGDNLESDIKGAEAVGIKGVLIKRPYNKLSWKEKGEWKRTITGLAGLRKFL